MSETFHAKQGAARSCPEGDYGRNREVPSDTTISGSVDCMGRPQPVVPGGGVCSS